MQSLFIQTEQQQRWQQTITTIGNTFQERAATLDTTGGFPFETLNDLRALHYQRTTLPKKFGGEGFSIYDAILTQETLARFDASATLIMSWTLGVVGEIFTNPTWEAKKLQQFADAIAAGGLVNRAASEAATGSPTRGGRPETTAIRTAAGYRLTGRKTFTTGSYALDYVIVSAWVPEREDICHFLLPMNTDGVTIEENWNVIAMQQTGSHDLVLKNVDVALDNLVETNKERRQHTNSWSLHIPSTYLGIAQAARDYAIQFAKTYQPNSLQTTISELPNVRALIGEMDLLLSQARFTLYGVATAQQQGHDVAVQLGVAKHTVTNYAATIVDKAMRIVGAKSLQRDNPLQRYYRDVRAGLHNPPMDDMTIQNLASAALR